MMRPTCRASPTAGCRSARRSSFSSNVASRAECSSHLSSDPRRWCSMSPAWSSRFGNFAVRYRLSRWPDRFLGRRAVFAFLPPAGGDGLLNRLRGARSVPAGSSVACWTPPGGDQPPRWPRGDARLSSVSALTHRLSVRVGVISLMLSHRWLLAAGARVASRRRCGSSARRRRRRAAAGDAGDVQRRRSYRLVGFASDKGSDRLNVATEAGTLVSRLGTTGEVGGWCAVTALI